MDATAEEVLDNLAEQMKIIRQRYGNDNDEYTKHHVRMFRDGMGIAWQHVLALGLKDEK